MVEIKASINVEVLDEKGLRPGLQRLGFLLETEIRNQIVKMDLISKPGGGRFSQGIHSWVDAKGLHVESDVEYSDYLEYGTYSYFAIYGMKGFPKKPDPKKRDMTPTQKKAYPFGMQPFAPFRRVLYNKRLMNKLVKKAFT